MLVVGSKAMEHHNMLPEGRNILDIDVIATEEEVEALTDRYNSVSYTERPHGINTYVMTSGSVIIEVEVATEGTSGYDLLVHEGALSGMHYASPAIQLMLKTSHKYRKDSPHFLKTMRDIQHLESQGVIISAWLSPVLKKREAETYTNQLPNLNVNKEDFFTDDVPYVYDHDTIHLAVKYGKVPAYQHFLVGAVKVSEALWDTLDYHVKLDAAVEESCVLSIERSLVGFGEGDQEHRNKVFLFALSKICTSITSGWFREFCWNNYDVIVEHYHNLFDDYWDKFQEAKAQGVLKPHKSAA